MASANYWRDDVFFARTGPDEIRAESLDRGIGTWVRNDDRYGEVAFASDRVPCTVGEALEEAEEYRPRPERHR